MRVSTRHTGRGEHVNLDISLSLETRGEQTHHLCVHCETAKRPINHDPGPEWGGSFAMMVYCVQSIVLPTAQWLVELERPEKMRLQSVSMCMQRTCCTYRIKQLLVLLVFPRIQHVVAADERRERDTVLFKAHHSSLQWRRKPTTLDRTGSLRNQDQCPPPLRLACPFCDQYQ